MFFEDILEDGEILLQTSISLMNGFGPDLLKIGGVSHKLINDYISYLKDIYPNSSEMVI